VTEIAAARTLAAELDAVWEVLADFAAISAWADNVEHSCLLERSDDGGPLGMSRRVQVGRNALVERIVVFEAPTTLAYDLEGLPPRLRTVRNRWELAPQGERSTLVTVTTTVGIGGRPPQQLAERVVGRMISRQSVVMLTGLAAHLEERARA
jgi:hypothetical protein